MRQSVYPPSQTISTEKPVLHGHPWTFINVRLILPSPPGGLHYSTRSMRFGLRGSIEFVTATSPKNVFT